MQHLGRSLPRFATCVSALCNSSTVLGHSPLRSSVTIRINPALRPPFSTQFTSSQNLSVTVLNCSDRLLALPFLVEAVPGSSNACLLYSIPLPSLTLLFLRHAGSSCSSAGPVSIAQRSSDAILLASWLLLSVASPCSSDPRSAFPTRFVSAHIPASPFRHASRSSRIS